MSDLTIFEKTGAISKVFAQERLTNDLSEGVASGFPIVSYRGKVWRVKKSGEERIMNNAEGEPRSSIDVVLVSANPKLSKIYYTAGYEEGDNASPDCFSVDGVAPDSTVPNPQATSCAACPHNAWGSKITPSGAKTKACADSRRMSVVFANDLAKNYDKANLCLLRVPAASLAGLKDYGEKVIGAKGFPYYSVITRVAFDPDSSYPKLTFRPVAPLNDQEAHAVLALRNSETAQVIVAKIQEAEVDLRSDHEAEEAPTPPPAPAPVAAAPPPPPPAAPRRGRPPNAAPKAAAKPTPPPAPPPAPVDDEDSLNSVLDSLLDGLNE